MIIDNIWYGHRKILSRYCDENDREVYAAIAHGQTPYVLRKRQYKSKFPCLPMLVWNSFESCNAHKNGFMNVISIGAPFLYLSSEEVINVRKRGVGTIFFPIHGVTGCPLNQNARKWFNVLKSSFPPPYAVSIPNFDPDFSRKVDSFRREGFRIYSFGFRDSPDYLYNLRNTILSYEYATSDDMGCTAIMYALFLGLTIKHYTNSPLINYIWRPEADFFIPEAIGDMMNTPVIHGGASVTLGKLLLGHQSIKSPIQIKSLLGLDSAFSAFLAKFGKFAVSLKYRGVENINRNDYAVNKRSGRSFDQVSRIFDDLQP